MANYMADAALNIAADAVAERTISVRIHSGAPGNAGTGNRIGAFSQDIAANGWTAAASGRVENSAAVAFGAIGAVTVRHYSLWAGATFLGWGDLAAAVVVSAGETFSIDANTIDILFERNTS